MKTSLIWTEETPLDISIPEANVEDLAVGGHVGVVAVGSTLAIEAQVAGNFGKVLTSDAGD